MSRSESTRSAVEILYRRYVGEDPERLASLKRERARAKVARQVYDLRTRAGLTQAQLAAKVGVSEAVIRRLEEADCEGDSLSILQRMTGAHEVKGHGEPLWE